MLAVLKCSELFTVSCQLVSSVAAELQSFSVMNLCSLVEPDLPHPNVRVVDHVGAQRDINVT